MSAMIERVAKAICCPSGVCHVETVKARENGKYLMDLPCYALGPDVQESMRAVFAALRTPTDAMLIAADRAAQQTVGLAWLMLIYLAMIDAALADDGKAVTP